VVRGGSLGCHLWDIRASLRHRLPPASVQIDLGFRCVQSAAESLALKGGRMALVSDRDGN
jgi:hypothetical protein